MKSLNVILLPYPQPSVTYIDSIDFVEQELAQLSKSPAIVVLPIHSIFSEKELMLDPSLSENVNEWILNISRKYRKILIYTALCPIEHQYAMRTYVVYPNGQQAFYDQHQWMSELVNPSEIRRGQKHLIIQVNQWKIMILTGEDLFFPEWVRMNQHEYHAILYLCDLSLFSKDQILTLLSARAIENEVFVIAGLLNQRVYERILISPIGQMIASNKEHQLKVSYCLDQLKWDQLREYTRYLPYKDGFVLLPPDEFLKSE